MIGAGLLICIPGGTNQVITLGLPIGAVYNWQEARSGGATDVVTLGLPVGARMNCIYCRYVASY